MDDRAMQEDTDSTKQGPSFAHQQELDAQGLLCPEPLMLLRNCVREMPVGATIRILATDPSTERDFSNYCRFMGHELLTANMDVDPFEFYIKKLK